jgi:PKD repeat protein
MEKQGYKANKMSFGMFRKKVVLTFFLAVISLGAATGQSYLIPVDAPNNKYPITFTDEAQQTLIIEFDRAVTSGGTSAGWTITVGGVPVAMVGNPAPSGNFLRIVLSTPISYANRNSVLVSYNPAVGTMSLFGGVEPNFTNIQAVNNYIATASDFSNGLYGELAPVDICAPVVDVQVESNIVMSRRYRNSIHYALPKIWILWEYPNAFPRTLGFYAEVGGVGSGNFRAVEPYAGYPDNTTNCTWDVSIYPYLYNTGTLQPNLYVTVNQVVIQLPNYKRDNGTPAPGTGELGIDPPVDDPRTLFCVGDDITAFVFEDATVFDCQLPVEPDLPNVYPRYVQYVYGTHTTAGIPNVFIDVYGTMVQVTDNNGDPISGTWYVNPDGSPNAGGYTTPSGFFEGPVIKYEWDFFTRLLITPMAETYPIYHSGDFINDMAGDIFDVTLRNWGPCNPWDGGNPFTYLDAVTEFSRLRLIESPPLPTAPDVFICFGGSTTLTAIRNGAPNPGLLHWYDDAALTNEVATGNTYTPPVSATGTYTYYVREIAGTTGNCPGPAEDVVLTINPIPSTPTITRTGADFCYDGVQSVTLTANPNTPPAITSYQWYRDGAAVAGATGNTIVLNDIAESGDYTVRTFGVAPTFCPSPLSAPVEVLIGEPATVNAGPDQTICSNMNATLAGTRGGSATSTTWTTSGTGTFGSASSLSTTYTPSAADISAGTVTLTLTTNNPAGPCPAVSDFLILTIVLAPQVNAGADATTCQGTPYTVSDATASNYLTLTWTENGSGSITAGQGTLTPTYTPGAAEANATVTLTLTATGASPCANATDTKLLYVDRNPVATTGPMQEICNSTTATFTGNTPAAGTFGEWTFLNNLVWQETFSESPQYATSGAEWTTSGITPDSDTWFRAESGRIVGRDLEAEAVWQSDPIPIASFSPVKVSVLLQEAGSLENSDYIRVFYSINGGPETLFTTNGNNINDFGTRTASVTNLSGNTLRIIIRCMNGDPAEYYYIDNIVVSQVVAVPEPVIATSTNPTSGVSGLWQGDNRFRWSVFSSHGGCDSVSAILTIRRDISPAAANAGPAQAFCETSSTVMAANAATNGGTGTWSLVSGSGTVSDLNNPVSAVSGLGYGPNTFRWTITSALGICPATNSTVTITRNRNPLDLSGNVSVVKNPVCYNTPGQLTITGTEADVKYYLRTGGVDGSFVQGNGGAITLTTPNLTSTTTYQIHAIKDITGCDIIFGSYTINVNPEFSLAQLFSSHNICAGATTTISVVLTGGTGPYTIVWNDGSNHTINNYVSGTNITVGPYPAGTTTISLTSVRDNNLCDPTSLGTPIGITVGSTPLSATLTGTGDVCVGATSSLTFTVTDGVPPYDIVINGVTYLDRNSGSSISLGALPLGSYSYSLTSVIDACGNAVPPAGLPGPYTFSVNEIPSAAGTLNNAPVICSNGITDIVLQSSVPGSTFAWTVSSAPAVTWIAGKAPAGGTGVTGTVIGQNLQHTGSSPVTVTYTIVPAGPASTFCPGPAVTRNVVVNPTAELNDPSDQTVCNGSSSTAVTFTTNRTGGTTTYSWTNSNTTIGLGASGNGNIPSFTAINAGTSPVSATITVTPSFEGCPGTPQTFTITVNPSAQVNDPADQVHCAGTAVPALTFTTNRTGGTTTYAWTNNNTSIGLGANGSGSLPAFTATNGGTSPVSATITVTPTFSNGGQSCTGTPQTFTITVNPSAQVNDPADQVYCTGSAVPALSFTTNRTGGTTTYAWSNNNTSIGLGASGTGSLPAFTATNGGTAPVTATVTVTPTFSNGGQSCTGTPQTFTITVNPSAQVNDPADQVHCNGTAVPVLTFTTNRTGGTTTYTWTNSNTAIGLGAGGTGNLPAFTATNGGTAPITATVTVTPTFSNGGQSCSGTPQTFTITVNPSAQVNDPADQIHCNGTAVPALAFTTNRTGGATTYAWTNNNTTIGLAASGTGSLPAFTATNGGTTAVTATVTVTPTFTNGGQSCSGTPQTFTITVNPTPALSSPLTPPDQCSNTPFTYTPGSLTAGTTFNWTRLAVAGITPAGPVTGTGSVSETLRNRTSASIAVTYEYVLTANGCSNTQNVVVTIKPEPVISNQSASVCSGESLVHHILLDNFVNPADNVTFTWPAPVLTGGLTGGTARTVPSSADMTDTFVNTSGLAETATYTVTPVYNGCVGDPKTIIVTVGSQPVLGNLDMFACSAVPTGLVLAVAPTSSPATTYDIASITVQAGLVAAAGNATAMNGVADINYLANDRFTNETGVDKTVTYRVRPVFGATCIGNWVDVVVTVRPQPVILPGQAQTVCSNVAASREILLVPANTPAGSTFSWPLPVMSDGSVQGTAAVGMPADPAGTPHITDTFVNYGVTPITATYTVTASSIFGCAGNPVPVVITINPEPAAPVITGDDMLCTNQANVIYSVPLTPGSSYTWTVPASVGVKVFDANSNAIIINAAAAAGSGTITVRETNSYGCTGIAGTFDVDVMAPSPQSNITGDNIVCALETGVYSVPSNAGSVYTWTLPAGAALIGDPSAASITVTFGTVSGNILVREVNAAGCITNHNPLAVTVRPLPTAIISNSGTVCVEDTHPVNITLTGAAPWSVVYAINGVNQPAINIAASPYTLNATASGNYTITGVTDANGCSNTGIGNATVSYWPVPSATISGTTAVCAGQSATLTISMTGTAPYTFTYTDGVTPVTVTNHPVNIYTFTVTPAAAVTYTMVSMEDSHGCNGTLSGSATVTINAQPVLSFAVTNLQCNGDNSGAIDLTVTGSATNSYAWLGPDGFTAGTEDISGLKAGLYNVTVTSSDGCIASGQATVTQPPVLTLSSTGNIALLCNGATTGAGSFTAAGGTAPYIFTTLVNTTGAIVTPAASSAAFTAAGAGTLTVRVTDSHNCTAESTVTVTQPPALSLTATVTNVSCFGGNNGTIITSVTGGTAPYIYAWTASGGGSGITAGAPNQGSLTAGTYDLTVTDANGCQITGSWTLTQPPVLAVTVTTDDNLIGTCSTAQLLATVTGGVMPVGGYIYSWSPAAGLSATNIANPVASPASTTTYTVTVTDANGCIKTGSITINVAPVLTTVAFADDNLIGACPASQTQLHVNVNGGEAPYSFSWLPVAGLSDAGIREPMAKPAATTIYTVTVTDANGCTAAASVTVNVAPPVTVTATVDDGLIGTCPTSVAHLTATATGGEGGYTYLWDNAASLSSATSATPTAKPAVTTTYTVTVTDANGCTAAASVTVNVAPDLAVTAMADDMFIGTCPTSVSHLDATVTGGEGGYTYKWMPLTGLDDSNIKTPTAKPAVTTTYTVTVTDVNGCTATSNITITVRPALTLTLAVDDSSIGTCPGSEAHITSTAGGGEPGYIYLWTPAAGLSSDTDPNPKAKPAVTTTYTLTVTDQNGCSISRDITVNVVSPLTVTASATDPLIGTCPTSQSVLDVIVTGGEPGYTYLWAPATGLSDPAVKNPVAKPAVTTTYTVTVTDNNGCQATAPVTVTVLPDLVVTASADDLLIGTCPTSKSNLNVTVTGGEAGYTYSWSPAAGLNSTTVSNPVAKPAATTTYTVTVTDANGCQATDNITITVAPVLTVTATADDNILSTCPTSVAQLTATATGGEELSGGGYTWSWAPSTGLSATNIPDPVAKPASTTTYTVTVTDANGCTATNTVTIEVRPPLTAVATATDYLIGDCPASTTTLDVTVTGGELPYVYSWAPAASLNDATAKSPVAKPAVNTTYTVTVTDANGCTVTANVTINIAPPLMAVAAVDDDPIGACPSSVAHLSTTVSGGEGGYTYLWDNAATLDDPTKANPVAKPAASTLYTVTVTDSNGCQATAQVQVNVAPVLTVTVTADDNIIGACPSSVANLTATGAGGELLLSGDYIYNWTPAAGLNYTNVKNPVAKPGVTTTYTVTITDRNGCTASDQVTITVMPPVALTTTPVVYAGGYNITCNGASDGAIDLGVTGGETPYTYSWSGPSGFTSSAEDISALRAGTYTVIVTDANNCTATTTVVLIEPAVLTLGKTPDVVLSCFGDATATGSFSVSGGTSPYVLSALSNTAGATVTITATSLSFTGGAAGEVTALVTDANGCTAQATIMITQPLQLVPGSVDGDQEVCYLGNPVALNEVTPPAGGPAVILFQWERSINGGATWSDVPGATMASYDPPAGILQTTHYRRRVNSAACDPEYSNTVVVTVNPLPVASIAGTDDVCPGDAATVTVTVSTGESPFTVVLSDGTTVAGYISGSPVTVNPMVTTTYTITSVTDNNGCTVAAPHADLTGSATIDVKTVPVIVVQPVSQTVCEDAVATFVTDAGGTTNPHYQWYVDSGSGMTLMPGEIGATLSLTATSAMNGNKYQAEISGDCPVPVLSDIVTLTVNEKPEIIIPPAAVTLCSGEDAIFTVDAGVTTNPVYQWFVNAGTGWTPATGARYQGTNTATLTVVSALEMMSGYQYMVRVSGTCTPYVESAPVTLTVTRQAEITQHPSSLTLCEGGTATFTVNAGLTTNPSYQWERSLDGGLTWAPLAGETGSSYVIAAVATADNNTAYRAVVSSSCGSSVTSMPAFLTVNELPEIIDQPDDVVICEYAIADFIVDAGATTGATYRWQRSIDGGITWNNLTETATYFGVSSMNLKVNGTNRWMSGDMFRVIVSGTCMPSVTSSAALLTVNTAPEILAQPVASTICENTGTSFIVMAQGTALTYRWYVDTGSGFTAITDGGVYSGATTNTLTLTAVPRTYDNYRYRVEIEGTCVPKAISQTVQLDVSIETVINTQPGSTAICEFMTASFTALADGANLAYQWQAFNGATWDNLANSGIYMGVQTPTLMVFGPSRTMDGTRYRVVIGGDCSADLISNEAVLTIYTAPELSDHPDEFRGCPGSSATFSVVAAGSALTYQWQVNSGAGFVNVTDNATYSGTNTPTLTINNLNLSMNGYLVRAVVSGTCLPPVTSSFAPLRVYMEPSIISEPADAEVCDLTGTTFFSQVFNTGAGETTVWQVNDGSGWNNLSDGALYQGTQTPQLVIMSANTAMNGWHYRLEITGPCGQYYTREALLTVNAWPTSQIAPVDTLLVCGGVPTQLHGNPAGGSGTYTAHRWFGDIGPVSQYNIENPVFNTTMAGYYRLVYQVTDSKGCVGLDTLVIEVEKPVAMFTADVLSGCQPLTVNFTNGSTGYTSLLWDFGDSSTSTDVNPAHTYNNPGSSLAYRTVRLEVTSANGCVSSMENNITVYPEILSDFVISEDTICSGESIMFSTLPGAYSYTWTFGDGNNENGSNVISHVYFNSTTAPVTYNVTLRSMSFFGCISETTLPVVVYPAPVPAFIAAPASQVFPAATVSFTNNTNAGTWTWLWNFDDGNTSADMSPVHTYAAPGDFDVSLTVSNGVCTGDVVHTVRVLPTPPIADFDSIPSGCQPWNVAITNTSLYATSYYWDFGDGHTSNAMNPNYTYVQAGTYQITLTVTGPGGTDTESQIVNVYPSPRAYFDVSPVKVYVNDEKVRLFNLSEGADSFIWEFGDGDTSHLRDPFHKYTKEGIYDITLHAYSSNGCYDSYTKIPSVTVEPFGDLIFATVFKPSPDGPIEIDELPTSGDAMDMFFFPPIRETVLEYHLQIFNRWGTLIFETFDINRPWNGYYKGKLCQQGVYVWLVEGKYANGRPYKKAGDITLLH